MPAKEDRIILSYNEARPLIKDGDILLYHGYGIIGKLIQVAGRSYYSHAGMAGWIDGNYPRLMCYEIREFAGGRITNLSWHVKNFPNCIDVYRVSDTHTEIRFDTETGEIISDTRRFDREYAIDIMRNFANPGEYGYCNLFITALMHVPIARLFFIQSMDDKLEKHRPPYCSQAIAYGLRLSFTDVVRNTPDHYTHPGDLDKSPLLHYMFTLGATEEIQSCESLPLLLSVPS